jgi:ribosomal protein L7Ae-like RNA K-turn-binding protein
MTGTKPEPKPSAPENELSAAARRTRMAALVRQARRAGRIVVGVRLNRTAAREGEVAALLLAEDLAPERRDALAAGWREMGIAVYRGWSKDELGELAGKPAVAVLGIRDRNIAAGLARIDAPAADGRNTRRGE